MRSGQSGLLLLDVRVSLTLLFCDVCVCVCVFRAEVQGGGGLGERRGARGGSRRGSRRMMQRHVRGKLIWNPAQDTQRTGSVSCCGMYVRVETYVTVDSRVSDVVRMISLQVAVEEERESCESSGCSGCCCCCCCSCSRPTSPSDVIARSPSPAVHAVRTGVLVHTDYKNPGVALSTCLWEGGQRTDG